MYQLNGLNYYDGDFNLKEIFPTLKHLLDKCDEAFYVCNLFSLVQKFQRWTEELPGITPFYAVKCNNDPQVLNILGQLGTNFDCASQNEIKQVLDLNISSERIIFANPCKPLSHLQYAKNNKISTITVDNEFEIYKIFLNYAKEFNLLLRFRSEAKCAQCPLGEKFGCDLVNIALPLMLLAKSLQLKVTGTSFHVGSGCKEFSAYERAINSSKRIFSFGRLLSFEMNVLDIGGGFPGDDDNIFRTIADIIRSSLQKHFGDRKLKVIAEPGRYFVTSAFTLLCKITAKRKESTKGKINIPMYYLNDGVYGSFNCILYDHQKVVVDHFKEDNINLKKFKSTIWGPTCDALDKIGDCFDLPNLFCGEYISFPNMGAYTLPAASTFNGFPLPKTLYFMKQ